MMAVGIESVGVDTVHRAPQVCTLLIGKHLPPKALRRFDVLIRPRNSDRKSGASVRVLGRAIDVHGISLQISCEVTLTPHCCTEMTVLATPNITDGLGKSQPMQ
jgi:hypothetical protein